MGLLPEVGRNIVFRDHGGELHSNSISGKAMEPGKAASRHLGTGSE